MFHKRGLDNSNKETCTCICANDTFKKCSVKITREANKKLILNLGKKGHTHEPEENALEIMEMIRELKIAAQNPGTPQLIYDRLVPK